MALGCGEEWEQFQLNVLLDVDRFSRPFQSTTIQPAAKKSLPLNFYVNIEILYC